MVFILINASMLGGKPGSHLTTDNKVVWGRTSTKLNILSRILFKISLAELKAKSMKISPTDPIEEEEKAEADVEIEFRSKMEEENLGKASLKDIRVHTCYRAVLLSLMIFLIRWVTQVLQPSLV
jgi:hypothetical protein